MSKFVGTGPSSYEKKNLPCRCLTKVDKHCSTAQLAVKLWNQNKNDRTVQNVINLT